MKIKKLDDVFSICKVKDYSKINLMVNIILLVELM